MQRTISIVLLNKENTVPSLLYIKELLKHIHMRKINNSILRSAFAIIFGRVLVLWPEAADTYLVIAIGICFILPGIFSLLSYFTREKIEGEP